MTEEGIVCCAVSPGRGAGPPDFQFQFCHPEWCDLDLSVFTGAEFPLETSLLIRPLCSGPGSSPHFLPLLIPAPQWLACPEPVT